jgi:hypothetical protein
LGGKVFTHHIITVKHHSSMRNWLTGLPEWIICEKFPWYQRKLCVFFSVHLDSSMQTHITSFLPQTFVYHCLGLCCTLSETCTKCYA